MATDFFGRLINLGTPYAVMGRVKVIDADEIVIITGNKVAHHCDAADLVRLQDLGPLWTLSCAGFNLASGVTGLTMKVHNIFFVWGGGAIGVLPFDVELVAIAGDLSHVHGSDPGAWTFKVEVRSGAGVLIDSRTLSVAATTTGYAKHNRSAVELSTPMPVLGSSGYGVAGVMTGPSTDGPLFYASMIFRRKAG